MILNSSFLTICPFAFNSSTCTCSMCTFRQKKRNTCKILLFFFSYLAKSVLGAQSILSYVYFHDFCKSEYFIEVKIDKRQIIVSYLRLQISLLTGNWGCVCLSIKFLFLVFFGDLLLYQKHII